MCIPSEREGGKMNETILKNISKHLSFGFRIFSVYTTLFFDYFSIPSAVQQYFPAIFGRKKKLVKRFVVLT